MHCNYDVDTELIYKLVGWVITLVAIKLYHKKTHKTSRLVLSHQYHVFKSVCTIYTFHTSIDTSAHTQIIDTVYMIYREPISTKTHIDVHETCMFDSQTSVFLFSIFLDIWHELPHFF